MYKLRVVGAGLLVCAAICLLVVVFAGASTNAASDSGDSSFTTSSYDSPNAVTNGLNMMVDDIGQNLHSVNHRLATGLGGLPASLHAAAASTGRMLASGGKATAHGIHVGMMATVRASVSTVTFTARIPLGIVGLITNAPGMTVVTRPADHEAVPVINPNSPALKSALAALPPTPPPAQTAAAGPAAVRPTSAVVVQWPIHGIITTEFGVPEPPYEPIHTGIDISDGKPAGVTPVRPFRAGTVIGTDTTGGLGNHVTVDHGNGVTSVYGHLARVTVTVGQAVDTNSILGYEGSTGVSTGPHVHFEIRVNGEATNPHQFIPGEP